MMVMVMIGDDMLVCCLLIHPVESGDIAIVVIAVISAVEWMGACCDVGVGSE